MQNDTRTGVIIMGSAGRDFHNFNVVFRNDPLTRVVAFTAAQIPDIPSIESAYDVYPHMDAEVPAVGYNLEQLADLDAALQAADADLVLYATPVNLGQLINADKPMVAVEYELQERGCKLETILADFDYYKLAGG